MSSQGEKKCSIGGIALTTKSIFSCRSNILVSLPSLIHCDCCLPSLFNRTKRDLFASISQDISASLIVCADYSAILSVFPIIRSFCVFNPSSDSSFSCLCLPPFHFSASHLSVLLKVLDSQSETALKVSLDSLRCSIVNSSLHSLSLLTSIQYNSSLTVRFLLSSHSVHFY